MSSGCSIRPSGLKLNPRLLFSSNMQTSIYVRSHLIQQTVGFHQKFAHRPFDKRPSPCVEDGYSTILAQQIPLLRHRKYECDLFDDWSSPGRACPHLTFGMWWPSQRSAYHFHRASQLLVFLLCHLRYADMLIIHPTYSWPSSWFYLLRFRSGRAR